MKSLQFARARDRLSVLCLGAHSDDIEIGAGATLLTMIERGIRLDIQWCVLSGDWRSGTGGKGFGSGFPIGAAQAQHRGDGFQGRIFSRARGGDQILV